MTLVLYEHPFAAYCWKVLIALYEREVPFARRMVGDAGDRERLGELWPMSTIPVLVDEQAALTLPESTVIVDHVDRYGDAAPMVPAGHRAALQARLWDRIVDAHVMTPVQKIVGDRLRPEDARDAHGVAEAYAKLDRAYVLLDDQVAERPWLAAEALTVADCAAAPALFYARVLRPWDETAVPSLTRYFEALTARPAVNRVIEEARPYRLLFPLPWPEHVA